MTKIEEGKTYKFRILDGFSSLICSEIEGNANVDVYVLLRNGNYVDYKSFTAKVESIMCDKEVSRSYTIFVDNVKKL